MRFLQRLPVHQHTSFRVLPAILILCSGFMARPASADPLWQITEIPKKGSQGGFAYTIWHSAYSTTSGTNLARMTLDPNVDPTSNVYNPSTGFLEIHGLLFDMSGNEIGTVVGTSDDADTSDLSDGEFNGNLVLSIEWKFDFDGSSALATKIGGTEVTTYYLDKKYAGSGDVVANSLIPPTDSTFGNLTLWGADGWNGYKFSGSKVGTDIHAILGIRPPDVPPAPQVTPVPEPASLAIWSVFGLSVAAIGWRRRRLRLATA